MYALSEIFTPAFFMVLAIVFIMLALLVIYIENKTREQNHKMASMLSLVSSLAEEINVLRFNFITFTNNYPGTSKTNTTDSHLENNQSQNQLILVSDDEEEEEDSDDEEEDSDDEDEEEDSDDENNKTIRINISENNEDGDDEPEVIEIGEQKEIKVLKVNNETNLEDANNENIQELEDLENDLADFDSDLESLNELEKSSIDFKSIHISHLEESKTNEEASIDYKKLPIQKLKSIVLEKGLISDANKLKKNDLLKLLGVE